MVEENALNGAQQARLAMRRGEWTGTTTFKVPGYVQCNLVVLPESEAYDFLLYCQRNPKACPLIEVTEQRRARAAIECTGGRPAY